MEFLKANFELLGINLVDGYTQSIDADQVADIDGNRVECCLMSIF